MLRTRAQTGRVASRRASRALPSARIQRGRARARGGWEGGSGRELGRRARVGRDQRRGEAPWARVYVRRRAAHCPFSRRAALVRLCRAPDFAGALRPCNRAGRRARPLLAPRLRARRRGASRCVERAWHRFRMCAPRSACRASSRPRRRWHGTWLRARRKRVAGRPTTAAIRSASDAGSRFTANRTSKRAASSSDRSEARCVRGGRERKKEEDGGERERNACRALLVARYEMPFPSERSTGCLLTRPVFIPPPSPSFFPLSSTRVATLAPARITRCTRSSTASCVSRRTRTASTCTSSPTTSTVRDPRRRSLRAAENGGGCTRWRRERRGTPRKRDGQRSPEAKNATRGDGGQVEGR